MKKSTKLLCLLLALIMALSFAACKGKGNENPGDNEPEGQTDDQTDPKPDENEPVTPDNPPVFEGGITFELPDNSATVTAESDAEDYLISKETDSYTIISSNDEKDFTFAQIKYFPATTSEELAPSFIDKNIGALQNLEFPGSIQIGVDGEYAELIIGSDDSRYVEVYLIDTDNGVVAVILSVSADLKDAEFAGIHKIVDTIMISK